MDFSIMVYAVIALVGVAIGWLFASYQHAQQKAEQLAEREEMVAELSAAKQQITQSEHWRAECELLNNEVRSLQSINTSLEADLREVGCGNWLAVCQLSTCAAKSRAIS